MKKKICIILTTIVFFTTTVCYEILAQTTVSGGIYANTTWTKAKSPYIVTGNITLFQNYTLSIEPGVTIKFNTGYGMEIRGNLNAIGTKNDSIVFAPLFVDKLYNSWKGDFIINTVCGWNGVYINGGKGEFKFTSFKHAKVAIYYACNSCVPGGPINVKNSNFENNCSAIGGSGILIDSCNFQNNLSTITSGDKIISNSVFKRNQYGLIYTSNISVNTSLFDGNYIALYGGGGYLQNSTITNNHIGVQSLYAGFYNVSGNYIFQNDTGIILGDFSNGASLYGLGTNNVICQNKSYNLINTTINNISVPNNCWCDTVHANISSKIYDGYKDVNLGLIDFSNFQICDFTKIFCTTCSGTVTTPGTGIITSDTLSISGTVHQGSGLLTDGIVMAIEKTTNKSKILRVTNGNFKLDSLAKGNYILYAIPNPVTVTNYLPTFYVNKVKLKDAVTLSLQGHIRSVDIYLAALNTSVTGTYTITGRFSYEDGNSRDSSDFKTNWFSQTNVPTTPIAVSTNTCNTMPVLLYNSQNSLLQSTVTDTSGYFTFKNLPADIYKVLGQRNKYASKNEGLVVLGTNPNEIVRLSMESVVTDFEDELSPSKSQILTYPNPFNHEIQTKGYAGEISVVDVTGKLVLQTTLQENETISTTSWPGGFYILKAGNTIQKLIKQ